jgi:hypothetical protein
MTEVLRQYDWKFRRDSRHSALVNVRLSSVHRNTNTKRDTEMTFATKFATLALAAALLLPGAMAMLNQATQIVA